MTPASSAILKLWSALVVRGPFEGIILPAFTKSSGVEISAVFDPTTVLMQRLAEGECPDVIVSTTDSLEALPAGILVPGSITELVRTGIGIGVADGTDRPKVATIEQLKASLRAARSVAYSRAGQSGIYFASLIQELGIAEEVNAKATVIPKGFTGEALIDGRADIAIQQISELRFVRGVDVVGPLPEAVQRYTDFSVALGLGSDHAETARRLHAHLTAEAAQEAYAGAGLLVGRR
jgi:molybdate transport system substrate-binding protein